MELNLKLDENALKGALGEAILAQLDDKTRSEVIKQAIAHIVTPKDGGSYSYGPKKSPLQVAFEQATEVLLRERVLQFCRESPEVKQVLDEELEKAAKALLLNNQGVRARLQDTLGRAVAQIALKGPGDE